MFSDLLIISFILILKVDGTHNQGTDEVCLTPGCVVAAARIINAMDTSVNLCDNFYEFACGSWIKNRVIPEHKSFISVFWEVAKKVALTVKELLEANNKANDSIAIQKAREYYKWCVDEAVEKIGLEPIKQFIEKFGGWPVLGSQEGGHWSETQFNVEDILVEASRQGQKMPLISMSVIKDFNQSTSIILVITASTLGMPSREYYLKERTSKYLLAYQSMLEKGYVAFGADPDLAVDDAKDVVDFEIEIANVDWKLINGTLSIFGMSVTESNEVLSGSHEYLEKVGNVIAKYPRRILANYLVGRIILTKENIFFYPKILRDIYLRFEKVFSGASQEPARWQDCVDTVKNAFPEVVGRLFVEKAFSEDAKVDVLELVENLRSAFKSMVDDSTWLDDVTKQTAKEKADLIEQLIGYPSVTFNDIALESLYENVTVFNWDPFRTKLSIDKAVTLRNLQRLRQPYDRTRWPASAATVNAYNYFITNQMSRLFDKNGQIVEWWTTYDETEFNKRKQCLIEQQYNNFTVPGTGGMKVDGELTVGENIADNGGSKESFKAYRYWVRRSRQGKEEQKLPGLDYTPDQLFFLNGAQIWCGDSRSEAKIKKIHTSPHCDFMFRVIGTLQNSDEFSRAWNCPVGSYMNPPNKCSVW